MQAADDVDFGSAGVFGFDGGLDDLLDGHLVGAVFAALAVEGAELAGEGADVGVVDVAIAIVVNAIAVQAGADMMGEAAERVEVAGGVEGEAVGVGEGGLREDFRRDGAKGGVKRGKVVRHC